MSSFAIMWRGAKCCVECPGTQVRFFVAALLSAAQSPVISTLLSIAISQPQGQLDVLGAALSVLGTVVPARAMLRVGVDGQEHAYRLSRVAAAAGGKRRGVFC